MKNNVLKSIERKELKISIDIMAILIVICLLSNVPSVWASSITLEPWQDTYVSRYYQHSGVNYGTATEAHHWEAPDTTWHFQAWSYYQFDLSALLPSDEIVSATLVLYQQFERAYGWPWPQNPTVMIVQTPTESWDEMTLTYDSLPSLPKNPAIEAEVGIFTTSSTTPFFQNYVSIDITGLVTDWHLGTKVNYGLTYSIKNAYEDYNATANTVYTRDYAVDEAKRPHLEITYNSVPIPGAVWLLGSGLIGLVGIRRKFKK